MAAAIIYVLSVITIPLIYDAEDLGGKYRFLMLGLGTYVFVWAMIWIALYTLYPY
jgi:hypothetical protein